MRLSRLHRIFVFAGVLALTACAGGGETGTGLTSSGNDVSVGTITALGSIWVNGVEFNTGATQVNLEGATSSTSALRIGMVVTVKGKINADGVSGTADQVVVREVIKGPIDAIGPSAITVLGQSVLINDQTVFEDSVPGKNISGLVAGNFVEVSGIVKSAGIITATRFDLKPSLSEYKVRGVVSNLDVGAMTFSIGTLPVSYGGLNVSAGTLVDGVFIEVKGSVANSGIFVASEIEADKLEASDADRVELEGYVASSTVATGGSAFALNNTTIQVSGSTKFSGGLTTDLVDGVYVEVEGTLQSGVLTATEVKFKDSVKIESTVNAVGSNSLTLAGVPNLTVAVDSLTEFEGFPDLASLDSSYYVSVRGRYIASSNTVIATRIEAEVAASDQIVLQGPVDSMSTPTISIMGISVDTSLISNFEGDAITDRESFFTVVKPGNIVSVEGTVISNVTTWDTIDLED